MRQANRRRLDECDSDQPVGCAEGPVLADRRRRQRPDQQIGIREGARRRRHQHRAGRRRVHQARYQWRRSVSLDEMSQALQGHKGGHHHHMRPAVRADGCGAGSGADDELRSVDAGAGRRDRHLGDQQRRSTTTTMTYADGSKVDDDLAAASDVEQRDVVLQFRRADDPAQVQALNVLVDIAVVQSMISGFRSA